MDKNQLDEDKKKDDENDPYKFFKFAGPEDKKDDNKNKGDKKKPKIPFFAIILIVLSIVTIADFLFLSKNDGNLIDYSEFR